VAVILSSVRLQRCSQSSGFDRNTSSFVPPSGKPETTQYLTRILCESVAIELLRDPCTGFDGKHSLQRITGRPCQMAVGIAHHQPTESQKFVETGIKR